MALVLTRYRQSCISDHVIKKMAKAAVAVLEATVDELAKAENSSD